MVEIASDAMPSVCIKLILLTISIQDFISTIQTRVDSVYEKYADVKQKAVNVTNVPRTALLKPEHAKYRLGNQSFALGERIVHVADTGSVPLGVTGTIIGIEEKYLEILFDQPFLAGSKLNGRLLISLLFSSFKQVRRESGNVS